MSEAYDYAEKNGYDYFTTVMTISRQKDSQILNKIGKELEKAHRKRSIFIATSKRTKESMSLARCGFITIFITSSIAAANTPTPKA
jgi:predicted adenine nucleotide alpha hydrolase (AANH) superfamily ATPase